jgi:hypothetical protein
MNVRRLINEQSPIRRSVADYRFLMTSAPMGPSNRRSAGGITEKILDVFTVRGKSFARRRSKSAPGGNVPHDVSKVPTAASTCPCLFPGGEEAQLNPRTAARRADEVIE